MWMRVQGEGMSTRSTKQIRVTRVAGAPDIAHNEKEASDT